MSKVKLNINSTNPTIEYLHVNGSNRNQYDFVLDSNGDILLKSASTTDGSDPSTQTQTRIVFKQNGSIIPSLDDAIDLGAPNKRFKDIYVSSNSIVMGDGTTLQVKNGNLTTKKLTNGAIPSNTSSLSGFNQTDLLSAAGVDNVSDLKASDIIAYHKSLVPSAVVNDIFSDADVDRETTIDVWIGGTDGKPYSSLNVGFGGQSNPQNPIDVTGNILASGTITGGSILSTSDFNLKEEIKTIDNPIEKLMKIRGVTFNWKKDKSPSMGVIAQEIEKVFPWSVVTRKEDGIKVVDYNSLIGLLIQTCKGLKNEIDELKQKINNKDFSAGN